MNTIIDIITNNDSIVFIINTEGDTDFWWWEISATEWKRYWNSTNITIEMATEFANDEENETLGTSCGSFETVADAVVDYMG